MNVVLVVKFIRKVEYLSSTRKSKIVTRFVEADKLQHVINTVPTFFSITGTLDILRNRVGLPKSTIRIIASTLFKNVVRKHGTISHATICFRLRHSNLLQKLVFKEPNLRMTNFFSSSKTTERDFTSPKLTILSSKLQKDKAGDIKAGKDIKVQSGKS